MMDNGGAGATDFLAGGGELGALIRAHDWSATPLGPPSGWPQSLKTAIGIMLRARQPIWVGWGAELTYFYNDAYKAIIGGKHPVALGQPTLSVWREIHDEIKPLLHAALNEPTGTYVESQLLIMERNSWPEETYYTFSYTPIPAEDGSAGGILCANTDNTRRVIGERQLGLLQDLGARTAAVHAEAETRAAIAAALSGNPHDIPFALLYLADPAGGFDRAATVHLAEGDPRAPRHLAADDDRWPLAEVLAGGVPLLVRQITARFGAAFPAGAWANPPTDAALVPLPATGERGRAGVLVVGLNPFRQFDGDYAGFLALAAGQIAAALAGADAWRRERERAEALAELDRAKTAFFSNISHEFRTPLTLMLGPLEDLLAGATDRALVAVAHRNGQRLMKLVNTLLDVSRIEAGRVEARFRPTDLAGYTADLASSFRAACERAGVALVVDTPPLDQPVWVDREMWEKIVLNLVSNAFKFTFSGEIRVELRAVGGTCRLIVRDTGIGIAADQIPRLFERFHRVEGARGRSFEGSGIGLALVEELVRFHGGAIAVDSTPGAGSAFAVTLPLGHAHLAPEHLVPDAGDTPAPLRAGVWVEEALGWLPDAGPAPIEADNAGPDIAPDDVKPRVVVADDARPRVVVADDARPRVVVADDARPRVVVADDNADMRAYITRLLAPRFAVEAVGDGEAALAAVRRDRPDLLLTDVMMPRLDGFGLLRAVRADAELRGLAVLMLSARAGDEAEIEGIEAGADDYLVKPFNARELVARVATQVAMTRSRRQTEAALRALNTRLTQESERLNRMFAQAPTLMALLRGPEHVFEYANSVYMEIVGDRDIIGQPVATALPEIADQGFVALLDQVYRSGQPYVGHGIKASFQRRAGAPLEDRYLDFVYQPLTDDSGQITGIFVQGSDVTERLHAESVLATQNRILELVNTTGAALVGEHDLERLVQMVTDAGVELTGADFGAFFHNIAVAEGERLKLYTLSGAARADFERFPMPRNTDVFAPTFAGTSVVRADDITADPRYGRLGGMPAGHLPVRSYLAVPVVSRSGEVIGSMLFGHADAGRFTDAHEHLMVGIAAQAAIAVDNARLFDAAQRELRERRQAEAALRDLNASLEARIAAAIAERERIEDVLRQAQKMEAVGQLTGGIAHDFNNLLTVITGNMDMALRTIDRTATDEDGAPRLRRAIGNALKGAERAAALTQRLLAFARRQPLAPQPLDVDRLIAGMSELIGRTLGETVQMETLTSSGLWRVEADPNQLEGALLNLAVNARDAMPGGGRLTIETANTRLDEAYAAGHAEVAPGCYVVIAVSDTGEGMSRETLARVFEPFFTTKEVGKGTGLGLSMVYGFVKQSGGHVKIYSEQGEGTTVKIYLPRLISDAEAIEAIDPAQAIPGATGETILVVEDDDDVRAYTVEILRELGYRVLEAHDGPAALRLIDRTDVAIDLLFTDVVMPAMSGRELAEAAHAIRPRLRVLYTSGYTRNAIVHGGRLDPGVEMIAKPFTYQALSTKVRDVLDAGGSGRLLLVEGDDGIRVLAAEALVAAGYAVDAAANAAEALGRMRAAGGGYDAVVLDLDLPDARGPALAMELRAMHADLPLMLSFSHAPGAEVPQDACCARIAKPWRAEDMREALMRLGVRCRGRQEG